MNKVLIVVKDLRSRGGVANYYRVFMDYFKAEDWELESFSVGRRAAEYYNKKSIIKYVYQYILDVVNFIIVLFQDRGIRIVQFNPSFIPVPILRDGLLLIIAGLMGCKSILFIRGWGDNFEAWINSHRVPRKMIAWLFDRADVIVVLGERFKSKLMVWGISEKRIKVSYTIFDGRLVVPFQEPRSRLNFLFLSRISREKGIFEIVEAASIVKKTGFDFGITLVGFAKDDKVMEDLKERLELLALKDVVILKDYLDGQEKYHEYSQADVFLLPSYHEGCPNSVLEAMASGLFVICSDAGALGEIVKDKINGFIVKKRDPEGLAAMMRYVLEHPDEIRQKGKNNVQYAFECFEVERITSQFKLIYHEIIGD